MNEEEQEEGYAKIEQAKNQSPFLIPAAIIVAGFFVAAAIVYSNKTPALPTGVGAAVAGAGQQVAGSPVRARQVSAQDHLLGNPAAPVTVIEYSDLECPFCKNFHATMHQIMEGGNGTDGYGVSGKVAWVYRQFPLAQLHPKAPDEANASECVAELGGNEAFWRYIDKIFANTPSNNGLDLALLPKWAGELGVNASAFDACVKSGRHTKRIQDDSADAAAAGGQGTPYSVVITKSGKTFVINGAQPYAETKKIIDAALAEK
ncbi:MAG: thioredoxin domain-containing protein [bacterium]|nr:thioredoxin domain-containing protein [bacterium]MDZ4299766.1 thioredoxin domain-containing protein [Candidatus Sungbacteria bacterium]